MPVRRRSNRRRQDITAEQEAWLYSEDGAGFFEYADEDEKFALWEQHRDRILEEHVAEYPGTRPSHWWTYDAPRETVGTWPGCYYDGKLPEPRERVGGQGTFAYEVQAYVPSYRLGIPGPWQSIDRSNAPTFESQATYLKRHSLFLPGEQRQLRKDDWDAETVTLF